MTPWVPTHRVPEAGLWVWDRPDGSRPPVQQLDPGLAVLVAERQGGWARVVCENGFTGWVDDAQLTGAASAPANPRAGRARRLAIGAGALLATGVVVAAALARAGGGERLVAMRMPDGWFVAGDGMVVAEREADLAAPAPVGAVVRAEIVGRRAPDPQRLVAALLAPDAGEARVEGPAEQQVGGSRAVSVTTVGGGRVQVLIAAHPAGRDAVLFTIDAPEDRYEALRAVLASVPGLRP